jgi:hypothetical protein
MFEGACSRMTLFFIGARAGVGSHIGKPYDDRAESFHPLGPSPPAGVLRPI